MLKGSLLAGVTPAVDSFPVVQPDVWLPFDLMDLSQDPVPGNSHNQKKAGRCMQSGCKMCTVASVSVVIVSKY